METRETIPGKTLGLPFAARCLCWNPEGTLIAIGLKEGNKDGLVQIRVVEYETMHIVADIGECDE